METSSQQIPAAHSSSLLLSSPGPDSKYDSMPGFNRWPLSFSKACVCFVQSGCPWLASQHNLFSGPALPFSCSCLHYNMLPITGRGATDITIIGCELMKAACLSVYLYSCISSSVMSFLRLPVTSTQKKKTSTRRRSKCWPTNWRRWDDAADYITDIDKRNLFVPLMIWINVSILRAHF